MNNQQSAASIIKVLYKENSEFWAKEALITKSNLLKKALKTVSAYKQFSDGGKADFDTLPSVTKDNYLLAYPWKDLCKKQALSSSSLVLTSTSGSTGTPFYFPRDKAIDFQSSIYHEVFLKNAHIDPKKSTLVVVCFGMGVWIGGVITYQAFKMISERGYAMTLITPGVNKKEIFEAMRRMAPHYDQVVLCGYPPFMKDIIDEGIAEGVKWNDHDLRIVFAAESFSEEFRNYTIKKTGIKDAYRHTMNIYGSADLGSMATETPLSILLRKLALKNKKFFKKLFNEATRLPTLAQYIPSFINFDQHENQVYITGDNVMPLIRYQIGDTGGVFSFRQMVEVCKQEKIDIFSEMKKAGIEDTLSELPFVYVYERADLSTKLYGAIIYPEYIKAGLHEVHLEDHVTGKFSMLTKHDRNQNEYLEINVELKSGVKESEWLLYELAESIKKSLIEKSAEYNNNLQMMKEKVHPRIVLWQHEDPIHFKGGAKQKWVKKN